MLYALFFIVVISIFFSFFGFLSSWENDKFLLFFYEVYLFLFFISFGFLGKMIDFVNFPFPIRSMGTS